MVPRVGDTAFLQHISNPLQHTLSAFWQNRPKRRKVGDTLTATIYDEDGDEVEDIDDLDFQWTVNNTNIKGATAAFYTIPETAQLGDIYNVVVTDADGNEFTSAVAATVSRDVVAATLIDEDGLQSDGTALLADTLTVTYTPELGNPTQVTWYKNGTAVRSNGLSGGNLDFSTANAAPFNTAGVWYAVITNTKGETFQSNSITKTDVEKLVSLSDFTLENYEAYNEGNDTTARYPRLTAKTDTIIANVTINKAVPGDVYLYSAKDKVSKAIVPIYDSVDLTTNFTQVTVKSQFTNQYVLDHAAGAATPKGIWYKNDDGSISYKFVVDEDATWGDDETLVRGTKYYLGFDQDNLTEDNVTAIGVSANAKENVTSTPVVAPYLIAPVGLKVKSFTTGGVSANIAFLDSNGEEIAWLGGNAATTSPVTGFDVIKLYNITNATPGSSDTALTYTNNTLAKGVATITVADAMTNRYAYASYTTTAGVFGETSKTLTTAASETAVAPATAMTVSQNSSTATSMDVNFTNLASKASGKVYILRAQANDEYASGAATALGAAADSSKVFLKEANLKSAYVVGEADVKGGEAKVTVAGAIDKSTMGSVNQTNSATATYTAPYAAGESSNSGAAAQATTAGAAFTTAWEAACFNKGQYGAIFVPDDASAYTTMISDNDGTAAGEQPFFLTESVKSWKLSGTCEIQNISTWNSTSGAAVASQSVSAKLQGVNQFGDNVIASLKTELTTAVAMNEGTDTTNKTTKPKLAIDGTGTITLTTSAGAVAKTDVWTLKTSYGTFTLGVKTAGNDLPTTATAANTEPVKDGAVFTLTFTGK